MAKNRLAVGLDIGSNAVKVVQLRETRRGYALEAYGVAPLPTEAIVDGAVMNSAAVAEVIQELWKVHRIRSREVAVGVSGHPVIVKKITLPQMTREELDESLQWEAAQYIPFAIQDVNLDVQILTPGGDATGQMQVLLAAAKKDLVQDYSAVVAEAGLEPTVVGIGAFAVQHAFEVNYPSDPGTVALVHAGHTVSHLNVLSEGQSAFIRDITFGGAQFTEEIQKQLQVSFEEAEALKLGGRPQEDSIVPQEVERILQTVADQLAAEVHRSLDFYASSTADAHIDKIYLSGGTARIPAVFRAIERRVGAPVEILNPLKSIEIDARRFDAQELLSQAPALAVAVGLGVRSPDDGRLNLLPVRAAQRFELGKQQVTLFALVLTGVGLGNHSWYKARAETLAERQTRITVLRSEIKTLDERLGEVAKIRDAQKALVEKLKVLVELKKARTGPVKVLDQLSQGVPRNVWLTGFKEQARQLSIEGEALSNEDLSEFIAALKRSPSFENVVLEKTVFAPQGKLSKVKFSLRCAVKYDA